MAQATSKGGGGEPKMLATMSGGESGVIANSQEKKRENILSIASLRTGRGKKEIKMYCTLSTKSRKGGGEKNNRPLLWS